MFEYQGWATILPDWQENEIREARFPEIEKILIARLQAIAADHFASGIRHFNGNLRCRFLGYSNHRAQEWHDIMAFFQLLAEKAPGSYGILSCRDDEDESKNNAFRVFLLKKGRLTETADYYLSPCIPVIEEL